MLVVVPDLRLDPTCAKLVALTARHGLHALWAQPVTAPPGAVVGTLIALHPAARAPSPAEVRLLADAGHSAGIVIEHQQTDELLRSRQAQLAQVGRMGLIGALSAGIAHEVHQSLASIVNYAGAAQRFLETPDLDRDSLRHLVGEMRTTALGGGETVDRIRTFLRSGEIRREWADLNDVTREAVRFGELEARRCGVTMRCALDPGLPSVAVDVVQMQQVVLNLVTNAIEAMAETPADAREIEIRSGRGGDGSVEIAVRDRGPGLPAGDHERLFEPLFSTKTLGSGLGLAICRAIVEAHEGRIWARANPEGGATFGFTLPPPSAHGGVVQ
jgi:signal transduction histidine kinase